MKTNATERHRNIWRAVALFAFALMLPGCYVTVGGDRIQPLSAGTNPADAARLKIQQTCILEPANHFGVGSANMQERCTCYAAGVVKVMNKEELEYFANYGLIPTISKEKYDDVKKKCEADTNIQTPGSKPQKQQKQKSGKSG